jgi:hypothetical protein
MSSRILFLFIFLSLFACQDNEPTDVHIVSSIPSKLIAPVGMYDTKIQGFWTAPPNIRICPDSGITAERIKEAVSLWEGVGYEFGSVITHVYNGLPCEAQPGEIAFRMPTQQELVEALNRSQLGIAKTQIENSTREIIASDIYFQTITASHKARVVEHELGHALGWEHHDRRHHIMNQDLAASGLLIIGMERLRYDERIRELIRSSDDAR